MAKSLIRKVQIFSDKSELVNLLAPIFLFFCAILELIFLPGLFGSTKTFIFLFIANVVLLNVTHVPLTFAMIRSLPELNSWRALPSTSSKLGGRVIGIYMVLFLAVFFANYGISVFPSLGSALLIILKVGLVVFPSHHSLWQIRGLSIVYNQKVVQDTKCSLRIHEIKNSEFREKISYSVVLALDVCVSLWVLFGRGEESVFFLVQNVLVLLETCVILYILWNIFLVAEFNSSNKFLFSIRLLAFPFKFFSLFALLITSFAHGLEYFFVWNKMTSSSAVNSRAIFNRWIFPITLVFSFGALFTFSAYFHEKFPVLVMENRILFNALDAFILATIFLHYYVDRVLFRMRDERTRNVVGSLLIGKN